MRARKGGLVSRFLVRLDQMAIVEQIGLTQVERSGLGGLIAVPRTTAIGANRKLPTSLPGFR